MSKSYAKISSRIRKSRRETIYKMLLKKHGQVLCFVCGLPVDESKATLEHIKPRSLGGTLAMDNLAISHAKCNRKRGASEDIGNRKLTLVNKK